MKPLLQHASRSLVARSLSVASPARSFASRATRTPSICIGCAHKATNGRPRKVDGGQWRPNASKTWSTRSFGSSSSRKNQDDGKPPQGPGPGAIPMPPPTSSSRPVQQSQAAAPERKSPDDRPPLDRFSKERLFEDRVLADLRAADKVPESLQVPKAQDQPKEEVKPSFETLKHEKEPPVHARPAPEPLPTIEPQQKQQEKPAPIPKVHEVVDNINRVPDEHLPSHRERQRWSLSKRFSSAMDDLLPKLAVVTQKVNTYTGTDYSGVEALRREIQEQEKLVKARRLAIESAKDSLDTALAHQAASQKKVVALLERKHSWSAGDLESYMALIRSEHTNDQAVRESKEAVSRAEDALEEARGLLEKRERAQYHEEQIWSDTIRRNSTWVTFGLMGVNIFLLLISLLVFEPWRRRRMVREIKTVLEAQQVPIDVAPSVARSSADAITRQNIAVIEAEIDKVFDAENVRAPTPVVKEEIREKPREPVISIEEPALSQAQEGWQGIVAAAQDIVSDRVIIIRRIDYTTAVLQGAATGAIFAAAILAWLQHR